MGGKAFIFKRAFRFHEGFETACVSLTKDGAIKHIWSNEMSTEEQAVVDELNSERFEFQFIELPFEGIRGTPVKLIYDSDSYDNYGILLTDTVEWENFLKKPCFKDFSDIAVTVVYLTEQGIWSHEHINPLYLDFEARPSYSSYDQKGQTYISAMMALTLYYQSDDNKEHNAEVAINTAKRYRDVCLENYIENEKNKNHV